MGLSLWSENSAKVTLFCVQHGQHRAGCGGASMMGLSFWSENSTKLPLFCVQHGLHRAGCGDASMINLSLWSKNSEKLTLFCAQHVQHRAGCGDASMMGLSLWSEISAKLPLFCAPGHLAKRQSQYHCNLQGGSKYRFRYSTNIWISIFGRCLGWAETGKYGPQIWLPQGVAHPQWGVQICQCCNMYRKKLLLLLTYIYIIFHCHYAPDTKFFFIKKIIFVYIVQR